MIVRRSSTTFTNQRFDQRHTLHSRRSYSSSTNMPLRLSFVLPFTSTSTTVTRGDPAPPRVDKFAALTLEEEDDVAVDANQIKEEDGEEEDGNAQGAKTSKIKCNKPSLEQTKTNKLQKRKSIVVYVYGNKKY
jgi:hypothetical protein